MQPDQEVINVWRDSARFWEKHREIIRQMFAPVTQALVEDGLIGSRHEFWILLRVPESQH